MQSTPAVTSGWRACRSIWTGYPTLVIPAGFTLGQRPPSSFQIVRHLFEEATVYCVAQAYEDATGGSTSIPCSIEAGEVETTPHPDPLRASVQRPAWPDGEGLLPLAKRHDGVL
jgi:hypothetical protein